MGLLEASSAIPLAQLGGIASNDPLSFFNSLLQNQLKLSVASVPVKTGLLTTDTMVIDVTESIELSGDSDVTTKPAEGGARLFDQSTPQPYTIDITGYLNERSSSILNQPFGVLANYASGLFPEETAVARKAIDLVRRTGRFPLPDSRITKLLDKLRGWKEDASPITLGNTQKLLTRGDDGKYLISRLRATQDTDTGGEALKISITLTEVRFYEDFFDAVARVGLGAVTSAVTEATSITSSVAGFFGFD